MVELCAINLILGQLSVAELQPLSLSALLEREGEEQLRSFWTGY